MTLRALPLGDGGGPAESQDYIKRAIYRSAPRRFEVDDLPPSRFDSSYYFGLKIYPILDNASTISGSTTSAYEIWRTWDDCLWFQYLLEDRYGVLSREKRHRLQAGKGVKKNGMYIHDRASSFESLPPGPDPKSVAKTIHKYLPKLSKRGTLFGTTQATVDQRQKEFSALIRAFFQEDVPSLITELRKDRVIKDFFGYWRRDADLEAKRSRPRRPRTAPADGIRTLSFISSFFSTSSVSLSPPHPSSPPISPRSASLSQRSHITDSTLSLPYAESVVSAASNTPSSAPARLGSTFRDSATSEDEYSNRGRKTPTSPSNPHGSSSIPPTSSRNRATPHRRTLSHGTKSSSSPRSDSFNVSSDFPLFLSSSTRDLLPASRPPHSPSYVTPGLGTLQEDTVLDSPVSNRSPPTLRIRKDPPVSSERTNRNFAVWQDTDEVSSSEGDVLEEGLLTPVDGNFDVAVATSASSSSPPPSIALSYLASQSHDSSWRTSSEHAWPSSTGSNDSRIEIDLPHMTCTDSFSPPTQSSSSSTLRRSIYGRRRRSLSQPLPVASLVPTDVGEGDWSDQGEDFIEAYLGSPEPFSTPHEGDSMTHYDDVPSDLPLDIPDDEDPLDSLSATSFSTPRQNNLYIDEPPRASHRPRVTASLSRSSSRQSSRARPITRSVAGGDTLVVKAALDDAMVSFRAQHDVPLMELRQRVLEKFANTEGMSLRGAFELSYLPPIFGAGKGRMSTVSLASTASVDWSGALPLRNERDWATAIASCGSKITVRVTPQ